MEDQLAIPQLDGGADADASGSASQLPSLSPLPLDEPVIDKSLCCLCKVNKIFNFYLKNAKNV
jgi:hypothetical protein